MSNKITEQKENKTRSIIERLPVSIQILCLQFLITPNERILLMGTKGVGKTSFLNKILQKTFNNNHEKCEDDEMLKLYDVNRRVKIAELHEQIIYSNHKIPINPTKIIIMADVSCTKSIRKIYNYFIPTYKILTNNFVIIINKFDVNKSSWKKKELKILLHKITDFEKHVNQKIPIHWFSIKGELSITRFNYITNEF
jgi:GTPase SAR1 family protein